MTAATSSRAERHHDIWARHVGEDWFSTTVVFLVVMLVLWLALGVTIR